MAVTAARRGRLGVGARAVLFAALATAGLGGALVLASRPVLRVDLAGRSEHAATPAARAAARELVSRRGAHEVVLAYDPRVLGPTVSRAVEDSVGTFASLSPGLRLSRVLADTGAGQEALTALVARLAEQGADDAAAARAAGERAGAALDDAAAQALRGAEALEAAAAAVDATLARALRERAGLLRALADRWRALGPRGVWGDGADPVAVFVAVEALGGAALEGDRQAAALAAELAGMVGAGVPTSGGFSGLGRAAEAVDAARRALARVEVEARGVARPDWARAVEALRAGPALLLIGAGGGEGPSVAAVSLEDVASAGAAAGNAGLSVTAEVARASEELLSAAVAALLRPTRPVVVLVHGESRAPVLGAGVFDRLAGRLRQRGIGMAEWAAALEPEAPGAVVEAAAEGRAVVYVVLSPNSAAAATTDGAAGGGAGAGGGASGVERTRKVAAVLRSLVQGRRPVLVCLNPSVFSASGEADPMVEALAGLSVRAETGRPVLRRVATEGGVLAWPAHEVRPGGGGHVIAEAVAGLPLAVDWPVGLEAVGEEGAGVSPLVVLEGGEGVWGESQWLRLWSTPGRERRLISPQPEFLAAEGDTRGPWIVAAAVERGEASGGGRAVVVGSNSWFADAAWAREIGVDGRAGLTHPGNLQLFESSVLWLCGEDGLIAPGATARSVPRVRAVDAGRLSAIRWGVAAGLPGVALVVALVLGLRR